MVTYFSGMGFFIFSLSAVQCLYLLSGLYRQLLYYDDDVLYKNGQTRVFDVENVYEEKLFVIEWCEIKKNITLATCKEILNLLKKITNTSHIAGDINIQFTSAVFLFFNQTFTKCRKLLTRLRCLNKSSFTFNFHIY